MSTSARFSNPSKNPLPSTLVFLLLLLPLLAEAVSCDSSSLKIHCASRISSLSVPFQFSHQFWGKIVGAIISFAAYLVMFSRIILSMRWQRSIILFAALWTILFRQSLNLSLIDDSTQRQFITALDLNCFGCQYFQCGLTDTVVRNHANCFI